MSDLSVTLIQKNLAWEDSRANLEQFTAVMDGAGHTDLIVLPEMFSTGFSMNAEKLAEPMDGSSVRWMQTQAKERNAVVTGSMIVREGGNLFNRLIWAVPDGRMLTYDKRHLFRMTGEHNIFNAGRERLTAELKGWRICPLICYDLRFPVWSRNAGNAYDLLIFIANWPASRSAHWRLLLRARAVENLCYVAGVNRVGTDGYGKTYSGDSTVIDPRGNVLHEDVNVEAVRTVRLNRSELDAYRESFPAWKDADMFELVVDSS
jgi:predicted amidohydrolase